MICMGAKVFRHGKEIPTLDGHHMMEKSMKEANTGYEDPCLSLLEQGEDGKGRKGRHLLRSQSKNSYGASGMLERGGREEAEIVKSMSASIDRARDFNPKEPLLVWRFE